MPDTAAEKKPPVRPARPKGPNLLALLRPYRPLVALLAVLTIVGNALNLAVPKIVARAIDAYTQGQLVLRPVVIELSAVAFGIFLFLYLQNLAQTLASERVARDLRTKLVDKISRQDHAFIQQVTPATLLTNLTSDVDAVKMFISQAVASLIASVFLIIGASVLLLSINWKLGLSVLTVLPVIGITFNVVLRRVRKLFMQAQQAIDRLNKVINESILGAALIRLMHSEQVEYVKFVGASGAARDISLNILRLFAALIPVITFSVNLATLMILTMGGRFVINGSMTLGDFSAFNGYLSILIFPVIMIGFMSNVMAQAGASYMRLSMVLNAPEKPPTGTATDTLRGDFAVRNVNLTLGGRNVLRDVSIEAGAGTRTAVIGPTAAGKTQLLYLMTGLLKPTSGTVEYDGRNIEEYQKERLHAQIGFVFQDTIVFNLTLRENIAFSKTVTDADLEKAIATAELKDFIESLPDRLDTVVSERGTSLSGGQKQRVMLARALALNPRVLLLDDFTARVDSATERQILENVHRNYPGITILSVTQKIDAVKDFDQIVVLMEGEVLASGTHTRLMETSPEYVQIHDSQRSTSHYELLRAQ
ncbi:MAG TPA: ABC transporter ATP-binding protein [Vicinamibacterales bacterium]|nr:ABC transporter ATP-binding protein [Vicinamibacterales bacterium]